MRVANQEMAAKEKGKDSVFFQAISPSIQDAIEILEFMNDQGIRLDHSGLTFITATDELLNEKEFNELHLEVSSTWDESKSLQMKAVLREIFRNFAGKYMRKGDKITFLI